MPTVKSSLLKQYVCNLIGAFKTQFVLQKKCVRRACTTGAMHFLSFTDLQVISCVSKELYDSKDLDSYHSGPKP